MIRIKKYCIILCAFVLLALSGKAQSCDIVFYGTVKDAKDQSVLAGANISISSIQKNSLSDADGHFHFNKLCKGKYNVEVSFLGYKKKVFLIEINKSTEMNIYLSLDNTTLSEIQVIGKQATAEPVYTAQKLDDRVLDLSRGQSLGESLKNIAGVNSIQTGPTISKPVIHGMHSDRILIYNSGVRLEGQQWGSEHAPEVDPFIAKDISVIKGAAGVEYGADALGGIILLNPAALNYHSPFSSEINLVGASNSRMGIVSGKIEGAMKDETLAWRLQGTLKKAGNSSAPGYYLNNTGSNEINGSLTLGYKRKSFETELMLSTFNTTLGIFEGAHIGSVNDLKDAIANGRPFSKGSFSYLIGVPRQEVNHHLLKLEGKKYLANNGTLKLGYSFQKDFRQEYDLRRGGKDDVPALDLNLTAQNLELIYEKNQSNNSYIKYGINTAIIVNNNVPGTQVTPLIPNYDSFNPALFIIKKVGLKHVVLEGGLRYDYKAIDAAGYDSAKVWYGGKHKFHNVSFSLGSLFHVKPHLDFRSDLSLAWRPPSVNELYSRGLHHGTASVEIGDKNLNSEKGYKWINTLSYDGRRWKTELSLYANYIADYIFLQPNGTFSESQRGAFPIFYYKQTNATFFGADLQSIYSINNSFNWQLKGSLVKAKDIVNKSYLPMIPVDRISNSLTWNLKATEKKWSLPFLSVEHIYSAKQTRYSDQNDFAPAPAAYNLFNITGGIGYKIGENRLDINTSIFNVFNTSYKDYLNRFRYYTYDTGRNWVVRLSYKF
ncbi:TonB-dependent receptor plug [Pseudopedobacter saltans DSM 12145]|uniref:TonB-dependent receptor plug n=1 Tax=Pseudopedobacter saltans (strain ATCC 51119 / DSM 12145 / JCM 21818 / CCUG 39354 / LMG 10337 / NBRC 100064 / NCIMB 13643) TaxID=762903 RepID=F0SAQ3_PSESL|nr:TonB-dependent receptor [Pseudopedobacter saltans]ADY53674.1 TonB-dependent receptor plug [Pseudopedobacter saltans DSM 12145]